MSEAVQLPMAETRESRVLFWRKRSAVSFPELVWAHFLRQQELAERKAPGPAEERYRRYLEAFEAEHGTVVDVYWCSNEASAVAVTRDRAPLLLRPIRRNRFRLHRVSDWATRREPEIAKALHDCDTIAVKVSAVLRDTPQRVALQWVYALQSYLLGVVDSANGKLAADARRRAIKAAAAEQRRIEQYYRETAVRGAQIVYFWGMMLGAVVMSLIGVVAASMLTGFGVNADHLEMFFACYVAGGTGAIVSVIQRVTSGHFSIDYELGRSALRRLGSFRPFLGAVFGVAAFFIVRSEIIQVSEPDAPKGFYFVVLLAFLAGFSERFVKDILDDAAGTVAPADAPATEPGGRVPPIPGAEPVDYEADVPAEPEPTPEESADVADERAPVGVGNSR